MNQRRGKKKTLVLTFNKALCGYIEDTAEKLTNWKKVEPGGDPGSKSKEKCKIEFFTVDGLQTHLRKKMLGKARSKKNQKSARIWEEKFENLNPDNFGEVFSTY